MKANNGNNCENGRKKHGKKYTGMGSCDKSYRKKRHVRMTNML